MPLLNSTADTNTSAEMGIFTKPQYLLWEKFEMLYVAMLGINYRLYAF